ncbi:hypothetical protein CPC08DRAFT_765210 [Agrocybe pediades]|nr:hypothetical protein CPC08DRAFT_765210 [Agrocybe pediades]
MLFSVAALTSFLAATTAVVTAIPTSDVAEGGVEPITEAAVKPNPDVSATITFCTRALGCGYPAVPITAATCVNFNHVLQNDVTTVYIPAGYVCSLFLNPGCSGGTINLFVPTNLVNTAFYANTASYRCDYL